MVLKHFLAIFQLLEVVIQYKDQDGRILSDPFMKLPTKKELPDYYEIIHRPVDIKKILGKIENEKVGKLRNFGVL